MEKSGSRTSQERGWAEMSDDTALLEFLTARAGESGSC